MNMIQVISFPSKKIIYVDMDRIVSITEVKGDESFTDLKNRFGFSIKVYNTKSEVLSLDLISKSRIQR